MCNNTGQEKECPGYMSDYDFVHEEKVKLLDVKSLKIGFINLFGLRKYSTTDTDHFEVTLENLPKPIFNYKKHKPFYDWTLGIMFFIFLLLLVLGIYIYRNCKSETLKMTIKSVDPYSN